MMTVEIQVGGLFNSARNLKEFDQIKTAAKRISGFWIRDHIRLRVGKKGQGSMGALKGYSTHPLRMKPPRDSSRLKPIISPRKGAKGARYGDKGGSSGFMFFKGGYREYKEKTGQVSDRFTMTNKGHFWRDWKILTGRNYKGSVEIGWSRDANALVADKAYEGGREAMFDLNETEMGLLDKAISKELQKVLTRISKGRVKKL